MSARWRDVEKVLALLDPVMVPEQRKILDNLEETGPITLRDDGNVVLVGHRAAGKSTVLPVVAEVLGLPAIDLDAEISRRERRSVRDIFRDGESAFRALERSVFSSLRGRNVVAVGGGFLALHGELLEGHVAALVPVSFETYRARLMRDGERPRLRPELPLDEEIAAVYREREMLHARVKTVPLVEVVARGVR